MLEALGIHGVEAVADPVVAALVTGDPLLLVGGHGTAKTALIEAVAEALALRFVAYDASKALFEDVIGFPNPEDLKRGKLSYVPTAMSIWGTELVFIDELSRAAPDMQNKWLEVIRSRRVMGVPVDGLRFVFAAMNPPGYLGACPLDAALAGRFAYVVEMPTVRDMQPEAMRKVIARVGSSDAPQCSDAFVSGTRPSGRRKRRNTLMATVASARLELPRVVEELGPGVSLYLERLLPCLRQLDVELDGRRLGMMWRSMLAMSTVRRLTGRAAGGCLDMWPMLRHLLPLAAEEREVDETLLFEAHESAFEAAELPLRGGGSVSGGAGGTAPVSNLLTRAREYAKAQAGLGEVEHHAIVSDVAEALGEAGEDNRPRLSPAQRARAVSACHELAAVVTAPEARAPIDARDRVMKLLGDLCGLAYLTWEEVREDFEQSPYATAIAPHAAAMAAWHLMAVHCRERGRRRRRRRRVQDECDTGAELSALARELERWCTAETHPPKTHDLDAQEAHRP